MNLKQKLIAIILTVGIVPAVIISAVSLQNSRTALHEQAFEHLQSQRTIKANQIQQHFLDAKNGIETLAENLTLIVEEQALEVAMTHTDANGQSMFGRYIARNDYYDLFLLDLNGYCFYSVTQEADYQTNLVSGQYKTSGLGQVVQQVIANGQYHMSDVSPYAPSNGDPAAFIAVPVKADGEVVMVLALQLSIGAIDQIMSERTGMGETGEAYLIGADKLMRSNSFLDPVNHSVQASFANPSLGSVDTQASREALLGNTGKRIVIDYSGNSVLSAYAPLPLEGGVVWNIFAEIDEAEAFAPIDQLQTTMLFIGLVGLAILSILALVFAGIIAEPMLVLARVIGKVQATGDLSIRFRNPTQDETGQAGLALNGMLESQENAISQMNDVMAAVAAGDFSRRVDVPLVGDFSTLKDTCNRVAGIVGEVRAMAQAKISGEVVAEAIDAMDQIVQASQKIASIVSLIDGIALQTNLLALSASVEAERAGARGRDLVNQTGEALTKIRSSIDMVALTVDEIASASNEQATGIEQVNHAVAQLDSLNQQNSALVEESAAAAGALTEQASELNELMQFFDKGQHGVNTARPAPKPMPDHQDIKHLVSDLNG